MYFYQQTFDTMAALKIHKRSMHDDNYLTCEYCQMVKQNLFTRQDMNLIVLFYFR